MVVQNSNHFSPHPLQNVSTTLPSKDRRDLVTQQNRVLNSCEPILSSTDSIRHLLPIGPEKYPKDDSGCIHTLDRDIPDVGDCDPGSFIAKHVDDAEESSGVESEEEHEKPNPAISNKRRAQNATFNSWYGFQAPIPWRRLTYSGSRRKRSQ